MMAASERQVHELMVTEPKTHSVDVSVGELRALFLNDHVHMALLVDQGRLVGAVEPRDISPRVPDASRALSVGTLRARTVDPNTSLTHALKQLTRTGRRRLAVVDERGMLQGLLCLKSSANGFCSDSDVRARLVAGGSNTAPGRLFDLDARHG
jgi:predicted transcriptional regulator